MSEINNHEELIDITVKTIQNASFSFQVSLTSTIYGLKERIFVATSVSIDRQRLIYRGAVLSDEGSIASYHIENGHTLHMVAKPIDYRERQEQARGISTSTTSSLRASSNLVNTSASHNEGTRQTTSADGLDEARSPRVASSTTSHTSALSVTDALLQSLASNTQSNAAIAAGNDTNVNFLPQNSLEPIRQGLLSLRTLYNSLQTSETYSPDHRHLFVSRYYIGQWVDVKDTVQQWLEATVMTVDVVSRRVFIHYNGWPVRWDEWIHEDSPRIAPFRTRTRQVSGSSLSPLPQRFVRNSPVTGADDLRTIIPQVAMQMEHLMPMIQRASDLCRQHATDTTSHTGDSEELSQIYQDLCPIADRFGRVFADLAPHLHRAGYANSPIPSDNMGSNDPLSNPNTSLNPFEVAMNNFLRSRTPSPPHERVIRRPINIVESSNLPASSNTGTGNASTTPHLDIHIAIIAPSSRRIQSTSSNPSNSITSESNLSTLSTGLSIPEMNTTSPFREENTNQETIEGSHTPTLFRGIAEGAVSPNRPSPRNTSTASYSESFSRSRLSPQSSVDSDINGSNHLPRHPPRQRASPNASRTDNSPGQSSQDYSSRWMAHSPSSRESSDHSSNIAAATSPSSLPPIGLRMNSPTSASNARTRPTPGSNGNSPRGFFDMLSTFPSFRFSGHQFLGRSLSSRSDASAIEINASSHLSSSRAAQDDTERDSLIANSNNPSSSSPSTLTMPLLPASSNNDRQYDRFHRNHLASRADSDDEGFQSCNDETHAASRPSMDGHPSDGVSHGHHDETSHSFQSADSDDNDVHILDDLATVD